MKEHREYLKKTNPIFNKEYDRFSLWFEIGQLILEARCWLKIKLRRNK